MSVPVIAVDGPSASGKGTVAKRVAEALGFHYLESGALYRLVALLSLRGNLQRDARDANRAVAPLVPAPDSQVLDSSALSIGEVAERIVGWWRERNKAGDR